MAETIKSHERRLREGWYERFAPASCRGLDIGSGPDPIHPGSRTWQRWDKPEGDATFLHGVPDASFETVYASHLLEHLDDPITALRSWWRVLKPGGHLIVCVPHRDLYEKKRFLPSLWNGEHKTMWLETHAEPPCTFCLMDVVVMALRGEEPEICLYRVLDEGWQPCPVEQHSGGEYSIEIVVRKPL
jgi:SAM-dependent methyltransferase